MPILLDTHTLLWFIHSHPKLSPHAKSLIEIEDNEVFVSIVSLWEIAIKVSIGKLDLGADYKQVFPLQIEENDMTILPISIEHLQQVAQLSFPHRDPFDRLLISQSLVEKMPIISRDLIFDSYGVRRIWDAPK